LDEEFLQDPTNVDGDYDTELGAAIALGLNVQQVS